MSDPAPGQNAAKPRVPWLLAIGAAAGLAIATAGLLETRTDPLRLPEDAAARVGERIIRRIDYERVLAGVEVDFRNPLDDSTRRHVLDRMIDEELLVQRALELGLAVVDRRVRGELTAGLLDSIVGEADAREASAAEVAQHFEDNVDFFSRPGRLHAQSMFFSSREDARRQDGRATQRVERALKRLRTGEDAEAIESQLGDLQISPIPNGMLPLGKIRDYVGPIILKALTELDVGKWSEPIESGGGIYLVRVLDREPPITPAFEAVEDLVRQDLRRRRGDQALRDYLEDLRSRTPVAINEVVFSASRSGSIGESSPSSQ